MENPQGANVVTIQGGEGFGKILEKAHPLFEKIASHGAVLLPMSLVQTGTTFLVENSSLPVVQSIGPWSHGRKTPALQSTEGKPSFKIESGAATAGQPQTRTHPAQEPARSDASRECQTSMLFSRKTERMPTTQ